MSGEFAVLNGHHGRGSAFDADAIASGVNAGDTGLEAGVYVDQASVSPEVQEGGDGRAFSTVEVGNSATLVKSAEASRQSSYHVPGEVYDTAVGTAGREAALTIDVGTLVTLNTTVTVGRTSRSGLMASVLQSAVPSAIGGPLVNLKGQVIGIIIGGSGSGLHIVGFAIPINSALAVATQIDDGNSYPFNAA